MRLLSAASRDLASPAICRRPCSARQRSLPILQPVPRFRRLATLQRKGSFPCGNGPFLLFDPVLQIMSEKLQKSRLKWRLDVLLGDRGMFPSRERARALIIAGRVLVDEQKVDKPGASVPAAAAVRLLGDDQPFVSRGGLKLAGALDHWRIDVNGCAGLDVGASTGGFTDCLLQRRAVHGTAVDTG